MKTRPSIRDKGLKNHLGEERYKKFVERVELNEPDTIIGNAIGVNRKRIPDYKDIYYEELTKHKN